MIDQKNNESLIFDFVLNLESRRSEYWFGEDAVFKKVIPTVSENEIIQRFAGNINEQTCRRCINGLVNTGHLRVGFAHDGVNFYETIKDKYNQ